MEKLNRKKSWIQKAVYWFVLLSFLTPIGYYIVKACMGQPVEGAVMLSVHALLGIFVLHLPMIASYLLRFVLPPVMDVYFSLFFYCTMFLGKFIDAYDVIPEWDTVLHSTSAIVLTFVGIMLFTVMNRKKKLDPRDFPLFAAVFAFCFALSVGALWEICEFTSDGIAGMDSQKFNTPDGVALVGRAALLDTMEDIIVDTVGSLVAAVIGYISLIKKKTWLIPTLLPTWSEKLAADKKKKTGIQTEAEREQEPFLDETAV